MIKSVSYYSACSSFHLPVCCEYNCWEGTSILSRATTREQLWRQRSQFRGLCWHQYQMWRNTIISRCQVLPLQSAGRFRKELSIVRFLYWSWIMIYLFEDEEAGLFGANLLWFTCFCFGTVRFIFCEPPFFFNNTNPHMLTFWKATAIIHWRLYSAV